MPSLWFKHKDKAIAPYEVPYAEGQSVDAIEAAHEGNGWTRFKPTDAQLSELRGLTAPGSPTSESSDSKSKE